ncbi:hypothetical protein M569_14062, partial [Genlisea aurea]
AGQICGRLAAVFSAPISTRPPLPVLVREIAAAHRRGGGIFVYGVGREGLMMKGLCMRLSHLGLSAHCVFDMTTPPISSPDLLVASAGPGGFSTVDAICGVARGAGARVIVLTARPETGSAAKLATDVVQIPAQTMGDGSGDGGRSLLPMGSVYEGALFILFEMVVYELGDVLGQSIDEIRSRHTNLE